MIHPSTMAGPNWFTGSIGTTNPFQQSSSPLFRNTPFPGSGFGPGTNPFQNPSFGFGPQTGQIQNTINEVVRQALPSIVASLTTQLGNPFQNPFTTPFGVQGQIGTQTPFGLQGQIGTQTPFGLQGQIGTQTPFGLPSAFGAQTPFGFPILNGLTQFGPQFQTGIGDQNPLQNPNTFSELVRQCTNVVLQSLSQQAPGLISQGIGGQPQLSPVGQLCQTVAATCCYSVAACLTPLGSQTQNPTSVLNFVAQVCQTVALCCCYSVVATLTSQNQTQNVPFNLNSTSQFGVTTGIPAGAGAF